MPPVWMRLSAEARSRWRVWAAPAVVIGLAGGVALAALAGAARTESAYDRFLDWSNANDLVLFNAADPVDFDRVEERPEVEEAFRAWFAWMVGEDGVSALDPVYSDESAAFTDVDRPKLLEGHSAVEYAAGLAQAAGARHLVLFHHDPARTDDEVHAIASGLAAGPVPVTAAAEGLVLPLAAGPG